MKHLFTLLVLPFIFSACSNSGGKLKHTCGQEVDGEELMPYFFPRTDTFTYTKDDSARLSNIKNLIVKNLTGTSAIKVQYSFKANDSVVIDVYGVEKLDKIDQVSCLLWNDKSLNLPTNTIFMFNEPNPQKVDKIVIAAIKR